MGRGRAGRRAGQAHHERRGECVGRAQASPSRRRRRTTLTGVTGLTGRRRRAPRRATPRAPRAPANPSRGPVCRRAREVPCVGGNPTRPGSDYQAAGDRSGSPTTKGRACRSQRPLCGRRAGSPSAPWPLRCTACVVLVAAPGWAHVRIDPGTATQGEYTALSFRVPTESDSASTTKVQVFLPEDHPIASVSVKPHPGWHVQVVTTKLATPLTTDDGQVTEAVSRITWTPDSPTDAIKPGEYDEFDISVGPLPEVSSLTFKALQTYSDGTVVRWIDPPAAGGSAGAGASGADADPGPGLGPGRERRVRGLGIRRRQGDRGPGAVDRGGPARCRRTRRLVAAEAIGAVTARADLRADCGRCFAICCVSPAFARSSDFAIDKPAGVPCPHLADDHRCSIHDRLRAGGLRRLYGVRLLRGRVNGSRRRRSAAATGARTRDVAAPMMAALPILRGLHELLWYARRGAGLPTSEPIADDLRSARADVEESASAPADGILDVEVDDLRAMVAPLLREASRLARSGLAGPDLAETRPGRRGPPRDRSPRRLPPGGEPPRRRSARPRPAARRPARGRPARRGPARRPAGRLAVRHPDAGGGRRGATGVRRFPARWSHRLTGRAERPPRARGARHLWERRKGTGGARPRAPASTATATGGCCSARSR